MFFFQDIPLFSYRTALQSGAEYVTIEKKTSPVRRKKGNAMPPCGLLLLYKPSGMTSQSAVLRVKRLFGADKAGHTGTLDPLAEGVLPVLLGRAVKASDFLLSADKHYIAGMRLGLTTDTEDTTGAVLTRTDRLPDDEAVQQVLSRFRGKLAQVPPMYSAIKKNGQKLCDLARRGVEVEREAREIEIFSLSGERIAPDEYKLTVHCSKGTYIRTLCADIGAALGCGAAMSSLCRAEAAGFALADCLSFEQLEAMTAEEREAVLLPIERVFDGLPKVTLPDFFARLAHNGLPIYEKKIRAAIPAGQTAALYDKDGFFAVAQAETLTEEDGTEEPVLRPVRQFRLDGIENK